MALYLIMKWREKQNGKKDLPLTPLLCLSFPERHLPVFLTTAQVSSVAGERSVSLQRQNKRETSSTRCEVEEGCLLPPPPSPLRPGPKFVFGETRAQAQSRIPDL